MESQVLKSLPNLEIMFTEKINPQSGEKVYLFTGIRCSYLTMGFIAYALTELSGLSESYLSIDHPDDENPTRSSMLLRLDDINSEFLKGYDEIEEEIMSSNEDEEDKDNNVNI